MWLLDTASAKLSYFPAPSEVPGGYAILSHTWVGDEQTFKDLQEIYVYCKATGGLPRNLVSEKIRMCCVTAAGYGYHWVWIDSCCIDKTSSTELSEAINSMFSWYVLAEVCFAYLQDVPSGDALHAPDSAFRRAHWHTRGWTLQELLAPAFVVFLSCEWQPIGTKLELAALLSDVTRIGHRFVAREASFLTDASVADRMHWASRRTTTRVENEAYCLLGLFDVSMPTLYGEGRRAFLRLQQEIIKQSVDTSLFVWGFKEDWDWDIGDGYRPLTVEEFWVTPDVLMPDYPFLLASSPHVFTHEGIEYTPRLPREAALEPYMPHQLLLPPNTTAVPSVHCPFGNVKLPTFEMTPLGMKCRFPVGVVDGMTIAVLFCQAGGQHIGLLLHPAAPTEFSDPSRPLYYAAWAFEDERMREIRRFVRLGPSYARLTFRDRTFSASWRDIYIAAAPALGPQRHGADAAHSILEFWPDRRPPVPFRVPRWVLSRCMAMGFLLSSDVVQASPSSWYASFTLSDYKWTELVHVSLGVCTRGPDGRHRHWAWAQPTHAWYDSRGGVWLPPRPGSGSGSGAGAHDHDCGADHIDAWAGGTRVFGDPDGARAVRLSFAVCPHAPRTTLVVGLELGGSVYAEMQMQRTAGLGLSLSSRPPTREALCSEVSRSWSGHLHPSTSVPKRPHDGAAREVSRIRTEISRLQGELAQLMCSFPLMPEDHGSGSSAVGMTRAGFTGERTYPLYTESEGATDAPDGSHVQITTYQAMNYDG